MINSITVITIQKIERIRCSIEVIAKKKLLTIISKEAIDIF